MKIAVLGAESTGKSELGLQLAQHLQSQNHLVQHIPEVLRHWCNEHGRTPKQNEQFAIATEQTQRIQAAIDAEPKSSFVVADTTALMVAIYSQHYFADDSLIAEAIVQHRQFDVTLLMGLDIPWVADGIQRDGAHIRATIDARIRQALTQANIPYRVVYGTGQARLHSALCSLGLQVSTSNDTHLESGSAQRKNWQCERCSDPDCEHRLFTRFL